MYTLSYFLIIVNFSIVNSICYVGDWDADF